MKYAKILTVGDPLLENLFKSDYVIEEKIDGSQFRAWFENGEWSFGSKGVSYDSEHPVDKMFSLAIEQVKKRLELLPKSDNIPTLLVFEYLQSPKQNTLNYDRIPKNNLVLLDVFQKGIPSRATRDIFSRVLDFETPAVLGEAKNHVPSMDGLNLLLEKTSMLGGQKIEGLVIKNYGEIIVVNGKSQPVFAKYVREEFKELNRENWKEGVPLEQRIMSQFSKEPRWEKAITHFREEGKLTDTPKDIGSLMVEVQRDFEEECIRIVQEDLWKHYRHVFLKMSSSGFPEFYKKKLLEKQLKE